jgi:Fe-S oxidoreductase
MPIDIQGDNRYLRYYLDNCTRCGACVEACHFYHGDKANLLHVPVYKNELVRRALKSRTRLGRLGLYGKGSGISEAELTYAVFQTCTNCRRCTTYCPFSIDVSLINTATRGALIRSGKEPQMLVELSNMQMTRRQNTESFIQGFKSMIGLFEARLKTETKDPQFNIPLSQKCDVLYVPLSGQHTILPVAKIFNAAKENWSMSVYDAANFAFLAGDMDLAKKITEPVVEEAKRVEASKVVITECGHAYRVMKQFAEQWYGRLPFEVELITETSARYLKDGRLNFDKSRNVGVFTHHDPCQHGRNGGVYDAPRYILRHATDNFVEMTPNREHNWCCGGGGGVVAVPDFDETRMSGGLMKSEQIKATGADVVTTTCDNCKLQISDLITHYKLKTRIEGIMDLTARSLVYPV